VISLEEAFLISLACFDSLSMQVLIFFLITWDLFLIFLFLFFFMFFTEKQEKKEKKDQKE